MRRFIILMLVGALVMAFMPASATAQKKKKKRPPPQEVEGSIPLPAPFIDDSGCYAGLHRRLQLLTGENANGIIGFHFDVEDRTWNQNFVLEATGGSGDVDLDIYFYKDFGQAGNPDDPLMNDVISVSHNTRGSKYETGKVPEEMNKVIVCMMAGGSNATFTYTAGKGVKIPKDA